MVSITVSVLGGFLYAIAPAFPKRTTALSVVALGRILGGFGRSNSALGFAYVARALTGNERTSTMALLGGVQMIGMAIAPLFSACLSGVDFSLWGVHFDYLNSVGLIMVIINLASQVVVYFLLPDLPMFTDNGKADEEKESEWLRMFRCILRNPHIGVPFLTIFTFNFNWQFIETSLAPASFDALGWVRLVGDNCEGISWWFKNKSYPHNFFFFHCHRALLKYRMFWEQWLLSFFSA